MLKIVVIADSIDTQNAGISVYTRNLIDALEQSALCDVICVRIKKNQILNFGNQIIAPQVLPIFGKDPLRIFFTLPRTIAKLNPDIVIEPAHFGPFNLPRKIKRVTVIHDLTPVLFPQWHNWLSSKLQQLFLPSIVKKASLIITNSKNTSKDLNETYPITVGKTAMIYPATDPFFNLNHTNNNAEKHPFFLSVGTLEPRKNLSVLLDAYTIFRERSELKHPLIICGGSGWKNNAFQRKLKVHPFKNDIQLKGYVSKEELKQLYTTTTAFIYPSLYEGFGFPVAEAMGCGAPCIVSNRASLPEVGGDAVCYFDPKSSDELAEKLIEMASSKPLSDELSRKGIARAALFTGEQFTVQLENFLLSLK